MKPISPEERRVVNVNTGTFQPFLNSDGSDGNTGVLLVVHIEVPEQTIPAA
ncbi:MAG: hypothetical protein GY948_17755 [Alphaproteobacteria bacterium]|nr:hypothetical protein [Alphaproteobacteria bacterium]